MMIVSLTMVALEIREDIGYLLDGLSAVGYRVVGARYWPEAFGDWVVDLQGPITISLVKDRGQYMIDGDRESLEQAGLWRAFNDRDEFVQLVLNWTAG